jgi:hypothetical protein
MAEEETVITDNSFAYVDASSQVQEFQKLFAVPDFYVKAKNRGLKGLDKKTTTTRSIHWKV